MSWASFVFEIRDVIATMSFKSVVLAATSFYALAACGGDGPYAIYVEVRDEPNTWQQQRNRRVRASVQGGAISEWKSIPFAVRLCAADRDAFLHTPVRVEIQEDGVTISDVTVERFACALSAKDGDNIETVGLRLDLDGVLHWQLGDDPLTYGVCSNDPGFTCPEVTAE